MTTQGDDELRPLLDEFVLFIDNTPDSSEPTELSVYLKQCGFDDAIDRLEDELQALISTQREQARQEGRNEVLDALDAIDFHAMRQEEMLEALLSFIAAQRKEDKKGK